MLGHKEERDFALALRFRRAVFPAPSESTGMITGSDEIDTKAPGADELQPLLYCPGPVSAHTHPQARGVLIGESLIAETHRRRDSIPRMQVGGSINKKRQATVDNGTMSSMHGF